MASRSPLAVGNHGTIAPVQAQTVSERIHDFLVRRLHDSSSPRPKSFALAHVLEDQVNSNILIKRGNIPLKFESEEAKLALIEDIRMEFEEIAAQNITTHRMPQRFCVAAFGASEIEGPQGRVDFMLYPPTDKILGGETEPANAVGTLGQSMRLTESMSRLAIMGMNDTHRLNMDENARLREELQHANQEIRDLRAQHLEHFAKLQDMLDRKIERDIRIKEAELESERADRAWKKVEGLLGMVIEDKFANGPLHKLAKSFDKEQLQKLWPILKEEQQEMLQSGLQEHVALVKGQG